jgi:uncharacterized protein (DUF1697 family)
MAEKKSILEEALLDKEKIQRALNANAREILRSVVKEEIDELVKESLLTEEGFEEEDIATDDAPETPEVGAETPAAEPEVEIGDEEGGLDDMTGSDEVAPEMGQELGMGASALGGDDMDMTAASDDDVIAIYKKLSGEDEIEIVGDDIHLNVSEPGEYVIKGAAGAAGAGEEIDADLEEIPTGDESGEGGEDDVDYEISMDDETEGGETPEVGAEAGAEEAPAEKPAEEPATDDDEIDEQISVNRVAQNRAGGDLTQIKGPGAKQGASLSESEKKYKALLAESKKLKTENEEFKVQNEEFRQALKKFRSMLIETVVMNANLTYAVRLISENATTKAEKDNIIKRFDSDATTLVESKRLYKTISSELASRKPISESIEGKLTKGATTSTSKQLNESTAYVDPSTQRIKDLINRVENKNK